MCRVLIVDWDVHHGNGIQNMFEDNPNVFYMSLHRADIYPLNTSEANCSFVGIGLGTGFSANIAWPQVNR